MPEISVIIPVYKTENYLGRCIDSILSQTFCDFELILVDDGSPDHCPAICDEYAARDSRIQVIHQSNQGQAAARNHGVAVSKGEWICFVDSDDMIHSQMLELLYAAVVKNCVLMSMCGSFAGERLPSSFLDTANPEETVHTVDELFLEELLNGNTTRYWTVWAKLISRSVIEGLPIPEGRIFEDNAIICRWLVNAQKVVDLDTDLYFYCTEPESTVRSSFSLKKLDSLWALEQQMELYHRIGYGRMLGEIYDRHFSSGITLYESVRNQLGDHKTACRLKLQLYRIWWKYRRYSLMTTSEKLDYLARLSLVCRVIRKITNSLL